MLIPHFPFVFQADGTRTREFLISAPNTEAGQAQYREGYSGQLLYTNQRVEEAVDQILATTERPTIIILQGDHGPESVLHWEGPTELAVRERYGILMAIHFPDGESPSLPEDITPVNLYPLIFNHYFGTTYPLQENRSYFPHPTHPYQFERVDPGRSAGDSEADTRGG